jgi:hypothetical protein
MKHYYLFLFLSFSAYFTCLQAQTDRHREEALLLLEKGEVSAAHDKMK